ncbi:MAG: PEP-CTERM sorting domain-containing protein, partial [Planctomycetia bacterium]|nr:PEP-CTERM sorting domain-containing protein [Planctomycetia bacterium]
APLPAMGGPITYFFSSGGLAASADFAVSGTDLIVTLTNTSSADALVPTDILTGIFVEMMGDPALTRVSAMVPLSSSVLVGGTGADVTPGDRVVGGEWAYLNNLNQVPPNNEGISSVGLNIFGPGSDLFPGPNLQGPSDPNGIEFGITSAGDNLLTGNGGLSGQDLIKNAVVFTLGGFFGEPSDKIKGVTFQYGTALDEGQFVGQTPEPGSLVLLGLGGAALGAYGWRRRKTRQVRAS